MPIYAIELHDASHEKPAAIVRDTFVNASAPAVGLPLIRQSARRGYELPGFYKEREA